MEFYQYKRVQKINSTIDELWDFISSPDNLSKITPDSMEFKVTSDLPQKMYEGLIISYFVKPLFGIKTTWVTEITHINEKKYFVDEQRVGPYKMWHHIHMIEPIKKGVLMSDIVSYKLPFGLLGSIANKLIIESKLKVIFDHREKVMNKIFGEYLD